MKGLTKASIVTLVAVAIPATALAQGTTTTADREARIGSNLSYHFDTRDPGLGAQLDVPVSAQIALYPSGAVYFVDQGSLIGINADLKYRLPVPLYVGGGLNVLRRAVNGTERTDAGLNLLGGVEGRYGRVHPFAEGRIILNDGSAFLLAAGLNIGLR
ncbi:MAG TPA: hypothetical protein VGA22_07775 [Gemmatimonadales bacterium]|jgi:hypothetical protein